MWLLDFPTLVILILSGMMLGWLGIHGAPPEMIPPQY